MRHIGCPVVGDATYGRPKEDAALPLPPPRQMLHAWRLAFPHPLSGRELEFEAPPPADFTAVLEALRARG
jgi:23S rRNA pseudouridine1911/1915/1917 synthase